MKAKFFLISIVSPMFAAFAAAPQTPARNPLTEASAVKTVPSWQAIQEPPGSGAASAKGGDQAKITISTDHPDGVYKLGEKAVFTIKVQNPGSNAAPGTIAVRMMSLGTGVLQDFDHPVSSTPLTVEGSLSKPGILMVHVIPDRARPAQFRAEAAAVFSVNDILPAQAAPDDFMDFWNLQRALLAKVPLGLTVTPEEKYSDEKMMSVRVSFNTLEEKRFHGWLERPREKGKYPALIRVMGGAVMAIPAGPKGGGYGFAKRYRCLSFTASVHDLPLDNPDEFYRPLEARDGPLYQYWQHGLESPTTHFYRSVIAGLLRTIDFLTSQDDWDGHTLIVMGGSQGGAAAYWMAGLDNRVTAMIAKVTAFTEIGVLSTSDAKVRYFSDGDTPQAIKSRAYYDPVFFARYVQANTLCLEGLLDGNLRGGIAAFNNIPHQRKKLVIAPEFGHIIRDSKILNAAQDAFFREIFK